MFALRRARWTSNITRRVQYSTTTTQLRSQDAPQTSTDYSTNIVTAANQGQFLKALHLAAKMKSSAIAPSITVYNALMSLAAREQSWLFAWAIFDDMHHCGVQPTTTTFAHLLQAQKSRHYTNLWAALQQVHDHGIPLNPSMYTAIIDVLVEQGNIEMALHYLFGMKNQDMVPELSAVQKVLILAANCGYSRLALELATFYEKASLRRLDDKVWMTCLASVAQHHLYDETRTCWSHITTVLNFAPDEGICLSVLGTAARHGDPELATDVLRVLKLTDVPWQEHHFAALIESLVRDGQTKEALITLAIMRKNDIEPLETTASFLVDAIRRDSCALDSAWEIIDEIHSANGGLGVDALNVVIHASVLLGDLQRAIGVYKAFPDYGVDPNIATYNLLLDGCIVAQHRQLGDVLLEDLKQAGLIPDIRTFEKMITLCLTQEYYEDAFYYLEEMKAARFVPPQNLYKAICAKCSSAGDSRKAMVLEEMKECGYEVDDGGIEDQRKSSHTRRRNSQPDYLDS